MEECASDLAESPGASDLAEFGQCASDLAGLPFYKYDVFLDKV